MAKGYIVVDIPKSCLDCNIADSDFYCNLGQRAPTYEEMGEDFNKRPDWCPIKEMPERIEPDEGDFEQEIYADGRNELINEMFGGEV